MIAKLTIKDTFSKNISHLCHEERDHAEFGGDEGLLDRLLLGGGRVLTPGASHHPLHQPQSLLVYLIYSL